jgi:hypothetical protein
MVLDMKLDRVFAGTVIVIMLIGCPSIPSARMWAKEWIGFSIDKLKTVKQGSYARSSNWQEKAYKLDNGNMDYIYPVDKGCFVHFEVDSNGIIINSRVEGDQCP